MAFDLVVRGGTVVDGSGRPRFRADVGVVDGRIARIGRIKDRGTEEIDAEGHLVTPGFIDGHTHFDAQVFWDGLGTCASWHGVTSVVMGNCGFTLAPCREAEKDLVLRCLERAEDIARSAMIEGIPEWSWETYPQYLEALDRLPKGINYAGYVGHSAVRTYVMGERAFEEPATDDDLTAMRREVEAALRAGAIGFSTSRSTSHLMMDDRPVASRAAEWDEVRALVGVMGDLSSGVFELSNHSYSELDQRRAYQEQLRDLAVESGRTVMFIVGDDPRYPGEAAQYFALLDETAERGGRMLACVSPREFLSTVGFKVNLPFDKLATWKELRSRSLAEQGAALADPELRRRLVDEALHGEYAKPHGPETRAPVYDAVRVWNKPLGPYQTVGEIAAQRGVTPVDVMIDLSLESDFEQLFAQPIANWDLDVAFDLMSNPRTVVAASDSGAHVSQIVEASIPTWLLAYWVRERQQLTWEQAVRMLTFEPASVWGFGDRGLVREGLAADLVVFDPETVGPGVPTSAADLPGGAKRLKQYGTGIRATVVNGQTLMRDNEHTGAFPGQVLRGSAAR
jgi:N-acyl-D-amino-acid deacylase